MARKKPKLYTADELRTLRSSLTWKRDLLISDVQDRLQKVAATPNKDLAYDFHQSADQLWAVFIGIATVEKSMEWAEKLGPQELLFSLADCGLEEAPA